MPVFNNEKYVVQAVESILNQTFSDFELIIVEDASSDRTTQIIQQFVKKDPRIRLVSNNSHLGIAASRNIGNSLALGEYIAVMDHDDVSLPERFEKQVNFLRAHPNIGVVGTNYSEIDENGYLRDFTSHYSETPGIIRWRMFFGIQFLHPTLMMRKEIIQEYHFTYKREFEICPDYDLIFNVSRNFNIANLSEVLYNYRRHGSNTFSANYEITNLEDSRIITHQINEILHDSFPVELGYWMKRSTDIHNIQDAIMTSQIVIRLYKTTRNWDIDHKDLKHVKQSASAKLRAIWHSQQNHILLIPYVFYSFLLYPGGLKIWKDRVNTSSSR